MLKAADLVSQPNFQGYSYWEVSDSGNSQLVPIDSFPEESSLTAIITRALLEVNIAAGWSMKRPQRSKCQVIMNEWLWDRVSLIIIWGRRHTELTEGIIMQYRRAVRLKGCCWERYRKAAQGGFRRPWCIRAWSLCRQLGHRKHTARALNWRIIRDPFLTST